MPPQPFLIHGAIRAENGPPRSTGHALVRAETIALLRALVSRFSAISIVDEPVPVRGILRNGWEKLWLSFT
jgi:hypothetical protein